MDNITNEIIDDIIHNIINTSICKLCKKEDDGPLYQCSFCNNYFHIICITDILDTDDYIYCRYCRKYIKKFMKKYLEELHIEY